MLVSRLSSKSGQATFDPTDEFRMPSLLNAVLYWFMRFEISLIRRGLNFAVGGSRLLVAQGVLLLAGGDADVNYWRN